MPTYGYKCSHCGHRLEKTMTIEEYHKYEHKRKKCPECKKFSLRRKYTPVGFSFNPH